jgi:hypothetical protein
MTQTQNPKRKTIPTADEVLAQQKADHAPRPVPPQRPKGKPAPTTAPATPAQPFTPAAASTPTSTGPNGGAVVPAGQTLPATPDARTNVEKYLDDVAPSMIVGRLVKFSKDGKFIVNDTEEEIGPEIEFIAVADQTLVGWIKFSGEEGVPPTRVMGLLYGGFVMPPRDELGDLDKSQWTPGLSGLPDDPWKHQQYLVLQNVETKEFFTFVTSSRTGRSAVGTLLRHYDRMRKSHPNEYPVVRFGIGGFQHRDERVGWVTTPVFVVRGRAPADSSTRPDTSGRGDMDDEIPF